MNTDKIHNNLGLRKKVSDLIKKLEDITYFDVINPFFLKKFSTSDICITHALICKLEDPAYYYKLPKVLSLLKQRIEIKIHMRCPDINTCLSKKINELLGKEGLGFMLIRNPSFDDEIQSVVDYNYAIKSSKYYSLNQEFQNIEYGVFSRIHVPENRTDLVLFNFNLCKKSSYKDFDIYKDPYGLYLLRFHTQPHIVSETHIADINTVLRRMFIIQSSSNNEHINNHDFKLSLYELVSEDEIVNFLINSVNTLKIGMFDEDHGTSQLIQNWLSCLFDQNKVERAMLLFNTHQDANLMINELFGRINIPVIEHLSVEGLF